MVDTITNDHMLINQFPDAIIAADTQGSIIRWNWAAQQMFGFSEQEALGQSLDIIIPPKLREAHWRGFYAAIHNGATQHSGQAIFTGAINKSGERVYANMLFGLIKNEHGVVCGVMATGRKAEPKAK